ncbi:hypothetical protein D920_00446 [Enterococcus faecalis 13-SD-W-01]|nr:hypothetical protein D920_00446 [Enterococcus faecalis 13-SD-W-01]
MMEMILANEEYKASTQLFQEKPASIQKLRIDKNSFGSFQILLRDGHTNHYVLNQEFSIPDSIDIPIYRVEVRTALDATVSFVEYYCGKEDIFYADKLLEEKARTYPGDRFAPIYVELPVTEETESGEYEAEVRVYRAGFTQEEELILQQKITVEVSEYVFPKDYADSFYLDIWQQPSNLARSFKVELWSDAHFELIRKMAESLAEIGQKAITVIAGEIPWKGWFNYIIKDYPANLYEYSMVQVAKNKEGKISCDFTHLDRYIRCFMDAGIDQEISVFGLLGVWKPPFFPQIKNLDYPEKLVIRYFDETKGTFAFIEKKEELQEYMRQVFAYFKENGWFEKVRILSDEPKAHELEMFKASLAELKAVEPNIKLKVAFDKEAVLEALLPEVSHPVTSYYCTCLNHERLTEKSERSYYVCNYPDRPNTFLHSDLSETRILGTFAHHFKMDGLLRWAYNCWPENAREDIRYNTTNLPIGDLCLIYPSVSGNLLLSLRYKQLKRVAEDFYLWKTAEAADAEGTATLLADFLKETDTQKWMSNSHDSNPEFQIPDFAAFEKMRTQLLSILSKKEVLFS